MTLPPPMLEPLQTPLPELAAALSAVSEAVSREHTRQVQSCLRSGATLPDAAALDDLPVALAALADAFRRAAGTDALELVGPAHASARDGQGFSLEELLTEYAFLRRSLHAHLCRQLQRPLAADEHDALHAGMDVLVTLTVASFNAQHSARARLENTAMSHFLASLAHDLRNEINSVMASLQLLTEVGDDLRAALATTPVKGAERGAQRQLDEFMQDVSACHQNMESTVLAMTRLLEAERLRQRVTSRPRRVDLYPLLSGITRSATRGARGLPATSAVNPLERIEVDCPPNLVVQTDPDLLGTVLVNLVNNAVKHAPDSAIRLTAVPLASAGCRIEVRDNGPGIPPDRLDRLFQKFERGDEAAFGGLGLGLFIARRAADLLEARLTVTSEPGRGSCFSLELPAHPSGMMLST